MLSALSKIDSFQVGGAVVQWLTLSPHRKKLLGLNLLGPSLYGFPGPVSTPGCPQNIRVELTGDSKLARDVDVM